jgi:DNA-binding IclR family transcriptional regulator
MDTPEAELDHDAGAASTTDGSTQYVVKSLSRGLAILRLFDVEHPRWTLGELVRATRLHKATCYRLVRTLEQAGFLVSDAASGKYALGPALKRVAVLALAGDEIVRSARPHLERLVEITGETADLTIWSDDGPMLSSQVLSRARLFHPVSTLGSVFTEGPATHVKLWLAFGSDAQRERLWSLLAPDRQGIPPDVTALRGQIEAIRDEGVAHDVEKRRGVFAVGAPVFDAASRMVAAISVVAAYDRISETERSLCAAAVRQVALELSRDLGYAPDA